MKRAFNVLAAVACSAAVSSLVGAAAAPACDPDNGGLTLPTGFCATVVAENVGRARHLVIAPNGDVFVSTQNGRGAPGGVVALRDTDGDGTLDRREKFGDNGGTGIAFHNGYLYLATTTSIVRYKMAAGESIAFDGKGSVYINVGAPANVCQERDRMPRSAGQNPCPLLDLHGGIWKFDENKPGQQQADGHRYATGMRQMVALAWHNGALWVGMHGRDALNTTWPGQFTDLEHAELPAELLLRIEDGANFGWPYCFFSTAENTFVTNPEYGGDGKKSDRCGSFTPPVAAFPGHWAPNDVMFYTGAQFPKQYQNGAFIAFHGSWNRAPLPQRGYNVTFQPLAAANTPSGKYEVFADGFAGKMPLASPTDALARPGGLAQGPDGSLYVTEDTKGKIWRIMYRGR